MGMIVFPHISPQYLDSISLWPFKLEGQGMPMVYAAEVAGSIPGQLSYQVYDLER